MFYSFLKGSDQKPCFNEIWSIVQYFFDPGAFLILKCFIFPGDPKAQLHTLNQAKAMALTCLDILTDENLLKEIRDEFAVFKQNSQWIGGYTNILKTLQIYVHGWICLFL